MKTYRSEEDFWAEEERVFRRRARIRRALRYLALMAAAASVLVLAVRMAAASAPDLKRSRLQTAVDMLIRESGE